MDGHRQEGACGGDWEARALAARGTSVKRCWDLVIPFSGGGTQLCRRWVKPNPKYYKTCETSLIVSFLDPTLSFSLPILFHPICHHPLSAADHPPHAVRQADRFSYLARCVRGSALDIICQLLTASCVCYCRVLGPPRGEDDMYS